MTTRTLRCGDVKIAELPNGDVELVGMKRGPLVSYSLSGERTGSIAGHGVSSDGDCLIIAKEDRCALAHLLAWNDEVRA